MQCESSGSPLAPYGVHGDSANHCSRPRGGATRLVSLCVESLSLRGHMPRHRTASLIAVGAIALPLLVNTTSAVAASPRRIPVVWLVDELKGSDTVGNDQFGTSVAISGTSAVVGADNHAGAAGRAYVFTKTATGWKQAAELEGSDTVTGDWFGESVAISGSLAVVGAGNHASAAGRAYMFEA